ncbi:serine hydrolase domain-containing protein [Companilactobacillus mishanensis]|uniref:serine hydrolase domain-containing protein n=1 Tax=Companilactobacillus mishanensis TaxID=2486008 RepID=UPI001297F423|nr:serine hydrolase domain-containing protein [Companilactobacillus mishanensis]MQS88302.1 beta-lactamase family protein [Companilactobacillus mishanensis]
MKKFLETEAQIIDLVNKQVVPGVSYGFISGSKSEIHVLGKKSWQPEITSLSQGDQYDLASLTKVMGTVPVIIQLIKEGKIGLHDPIHNYLPDFKDSRVEIFHLLTHTSGIAGYIPDRDSLSADQLIDALLKLPVTENFDKKVVYTDTGLIFLGLIIEQFYQQPVQRVIEKTVLKEWNLNDTTFEPQIGRCVPTYRVDGRYLTGIPNDPKARQLGLRCGSAGMFSTIEDVMKFAQIMLEPDYKNLYHNYTHLDPGRSLGWDIKPDGSGHLLFHTGYTGHFIAVDHETQNAMVVLTNRVHPVEHNDLFLRRRDNILQDFLNEDKK